MSPAEQEMKAATRPIRIAAIIAVLGTLIVGLGLLVLHNVMEARSHAAVSDARH